MCSVGIDVDRGRGEADNAVNTHVLMPVAENRAGRVNRMAGPVDRRERRPGDRALLNMREDPCGWESGPSIRVQQTPLQ